MLRIANKVFFAQDKICPNIAATYVPSYEEFKSQYENLDNMYYTLACKNADVYHTVYSFSEQDYMIAIAEYAKFLRLTYDEYQIISCFFDDQVNYDTEFSERTRKGCSHVYNVMSELSYEKINPDSKPTIYSIFPAEYAINCLDKEWAIKKYNFFKLNYLYVQIKNDILQRYINNKPMPQIYNLFKRQGWEGVTLLQEKFIHDRAIETLRKYNIATNVIDMSVQEFAARIKEFPYTDNCNLLLNYKLIDKLRTRKYRIDSL